MGGQNRRRFLQVTVGGILAGISLKDQAVQAAAVQPVADLTEQVQGTIVLLNLKVHDEVWLRFGAGDSTPELYRVTRTTDRGTGERQIELATDGKRTLKLRIPRR